MISILVLTITLGAVFYINDINQKKDKIAVDIKTNPSSAKTIINGKEYKNGTVYIPEGIYEVEIKHEDFETLKQKLEVNKKVLSKPTVLVSLTPNSKKGEKWVENHQKQIKEFEKIQFQISDEYGRAWTEKYPVIQKLPIKDPYYTISYRRTDGDGIFLTVKATSARYRQAAIKEMYRQDIDPTDYKVEFLGYENPLLNEDN